MFELTILISTFAALLYGGKTNFVKELCQQFHS